MRQMNLVYSMRSKKKVKKRRIITVLGLSITLYLSACGKQEPVSTVEPTETIEATTEQSEPETEETTETTEEINNKMFGLDGITASEDTTSSSETSSSGMNTSQPYYPSSTPCGNSQKQQAWNNFCNNWNESDYGTTTKGKTQNDFPYYGRTGYDSSLLEYRTTDKGYTVFYDTNTGRVYYTGMTLPTGDAWDENESAAVLTTYALSKGYNGFYDITYAEMQELLGTYAGD